MSYGVLFVTNLHRRDLSAHLIPGSHEGSIHDTLLRHPKLTSVLPLFHTNFPIPLNKYAPLWPILVAGPKPLCSWLGPVVRPELKLILPPLVSRAPSDCQRSEW